MEEQRAAKQGSEVTAVAGTELDTAPAPVEVSALQQQSEEDSTDLENRICRVCLAGESDGEEEDEEVECDKYVGWSTRFRALGSRLGVVASHRSSHLDHAIRNRLIAPCGCTGSSRWIHTGCLRSWIVTLAIQGRVNLVCELCNHRYDLSRADCRELRHSLLGTQRAVQLRRCPITFSHLSAVFLLFWMLIEFRSGSSFMSACLMWTACVIQTEGENGNIFRVIGKVGVPIVALLLAKYYDWDWDFGGPRWLASSSQVFALEPGIVLRFLPSAAGNSLMGSVLLLTEYSYKEGAVGYLMNRPLSAKNQNMDSFEDYVKRGEGGLQHRDGDDWRMFIWNEDSEQAQTFPEKDWEHVKGHPGLIIDRGLRPEVRSGLQLSDRQHALLLQGYMTWLPTELDLEVNRGVWSMHEVPTGLFFIDFRTSVFELIGKMPALSRFKWKPKADPAADESDAGR